MMMAGAVIITHGDLARSLLGAAESITGAVEGVIPVCVNKGDTTEGIRQGLAQAVKSVDKGAGVIIFTDMFGGTPTNIALSLLSAGRVEVITGVNLPLLLNTLLKFNFSISGATSSLHPASISTSKLKMAPIFIILFFIVVRF